MTRMGNLVVALAASAAASEVWDADPRVFANQYDAAATKFDFYVFAHSWQAEFCHGMSYPGCANPEPYWESHFTIHGLWPELEKGPHPGFCTKEVFDSDNVRKSIGDGVLLQYWPNVKVAVNTSLYDSFWDHEWKRHGTCSGLDQVTFFKSAIDKIQKQGTPDFIVQNVGQAVSASAIRNAYGGPKYAALQCSKGNRLSQVYTCLDKDSNNLPTIQRQCSAAVLNEDTCNSASTVLIPSF
ncbi:hypothetical protein AC1031_008575 [Aphanomyces cochlioides]|nr:hypothetical protein AC1031_008575 [Aphanomyces cochlioides]